MFYGNYDFNTIYRTDYVPKNLKKPYRVKELDISNNCLNNVLKTDDCLVLKPEHIKKTEDKYCPPEGVDIKDAIELVHKKHPELGERYFSEPLKTDAIELKIEYKPRSIYQVDYCKRGFCYSRNIVDKIDFGIRLGDDHPLPDTTTQDFHRDLSTIAYRGIERTKSLRPIIDYTLKRKTEEILGMTCGNTTYEMCHGMLGRAVMEHMPFGPPCYVNPECNRWGHPVLGGYTHSIRA